MTSPSRRTAALYLALVFAAGAAFGVAANEFYSTKVASAVNRRPTPSEFRQRIIDDLTRDLNLDAAQSDEVSRIYDGIGEKYKQVRDEMEPRFDAIRKQRAEQIMAVLNPEQQAKYQSMLEERRRKREQRSSRHR
jgi:Spy/CpxP family protein refolding chaperone